MSQSEKSYYLKSGLFSFFEKTSIFILGVLSFMLLARAISEYDLGIWSVYMTIAALIEVGIVGLLQNGLVKYLSNAKPEEEGKIISSSLVLALIATGIFGIILYFTSPFISDQVQKIDTDSGNSLATLLKLLIVLLFALIPLNLFNFIQQAKLNFTGVFWGNFTRRFIFFLFVVAIFFELVPFSFTSLVTSQIVAALLAGIVGWTFCKVYIPAKAFTNFDKTWLSTLFHYGKYVFGTNLSAMVYKSIDKLMLAKFLTPIAVSYYDVAIRVTNMADVPSLTVASVVFPQSAIQSSQASEEEKKKKIKDLYEKSVGAILAILLPFIIGVLVVPELIIYILAGEKYMYMATPILRLTILYGLFLPFLLQFGTILDSIGKPTINFIFTIGGMILNVVFNYLFIEYFGYGLYGAAYGTLLTYSLTFIVNQTLLNRMFNINPLNAFLHVPFFYKQAIDVLKEFIDKRRKAAEQ